MALARLASASASALRAAAGSSRAVGSSALRPTPELRRVVAHASPQPRCRRTRQPDASPPQISRIVAALRRAAILIRGEARLARQSGGFHAGRPETPAPPPPGLAARVAAARAVAEALTSARPLEERLAADLAQQRGGLDARDRGLARSIATVVDAPARHDPQGAGAATGKGHAQARRRAGMDADRGRGANPVSRYSRPCGGRPRGEGDARRTRRALHSPRSPMRCCAPSPATAMTFSPVPIPSTTTRQRGSPQRWRSTYGESVARAIAAAHRSEPTLDLSVKSDPAGWAEQLGGIVLPTGSVRLDTHAPIAELEGYADGEWWVQDAAAALPARLLRPAPGMRIVDLCAAPGGKAAELAAAGADVIDGRSLGRAAQVARRQFRPPAPSLRGRRRRRPHLRSAAV